MPTPRHPQDKVAAQDTCYIADGKVFTQDEYIFLHELRHVAVFLSSEYTTHSSMQNTATSVRNWEVPADFGVDGRRSRTRQNHHGHGSGDGRAGHGVGSAVL